VTTDDRTAVRDRLCAAATELFYAEGVHSVGIDRVIERAGVAKATLYNVFGSKSELVRAYLLDRHELLTGHLLAATTIDAPPRARVLAVFDLLGVLISDPAYRGCPFVNASAESPDDGVLEVSDLHREWVRKMFERLVREAGARSSRRIAQQLVILYDGVLVGAQMDRTNTGPAAAREVAGLIIDTATSR
jgi:AcrR family transcriptional regulator